MAISFVGSTGLADTNDSNTTYTLNKPSGIQSGDFLLGFIAYWVTSGSERTVTPPSGWTLVRSAFAPAGFSFQLAVVSKVASSSEPSSWTGSFSSTMGGGVTIVAAYRGTTSFAVHGESSVGSATSYSTATVNNPSTNNWRIVSAGYTSLSLSYEIDSNEVNERRIIGHDYSGDAVEIGLWDDGGSSSTGNTSRTISRGQQWDSSASFIGILTASNTTSSGSLGMDLFLPVMAGVADISYHAAMAATLPQLTMTSDGIASPPEGPLDVLILPVVEVSGAHEASGTLSASLTLSMAVVGETRRFGIRVVSPEPESRVTTPRLGAVD